MSDAVPPVRPAGYWQASDGNWYPPEQHPDYLPPASPPGQQPWNAIPLQAPKKGKVKWIALGIVGLLVVASAAAAGSKDEKKAADLATNSATAPTTAAPTAIAPTTAAPTRAAAATTAK